MYKGNLQRRWQEEKPAVYDKETHLVCLDIIQEAQRDEDGNEKEGYSFFQVEIDEHIDYGHIKCQLIEAGAAQKDEFGLLMNAVDGILTAVGDGDSWSSFKKNLDVEDIRAFTEFCAFRQMCANAAKEVLKAY